MRRKQIFNLFLQRFVARTTFSNEGRALAWVALKHGVKDSIDLLPTFGRHRLSDLHARIILETSNCSRILASDCLAQPGFGERPIAHDCPR